MAAFGITFPKLTLCRTTPSKVDTNTLSTTTIAPITASARTLSLSIKNVPSQSLHYNVSTTTPKKKTTPITTILAIDGETKQLSKNLSVFNELQLDDEAEDINETRRRRENSSDVIVPSLLPPAGTINHLSHLRFNASVEAKPSPNNSKNTEKTPLPERRSNQTFTPPTSSLSQNSSSNDLQLTSSSLSVDLPQLKYAIENFLVDDNDNDNPAYQIADEFSFGRSLFHSDQNGNAHNSNETKSDLKDQQHDQMEHTELYTTWEENINEEVLSHPAPMSNSMKWYVSELRINRPLIYRTQWTNGQQHSSNRKFSHSVSDLNNIYNFSNCPTTDQTRKANAIAYSTVSLHNFINHQQRYHHQSDDNILFNNHLSSTDDDLNPFHSDEDDSRLSPSVMQRTIDRSVGRNDTLIRNESVKKKLFDILNDDELENACLKDMSQEFERISLVDQHPHHDLPILNSFSSSSDDALYSSPPNELHMPLLPPPLSSSYNEILSANINNSTERHFGRSRLFTTSLDKIPMNNNASDHSSSTRFSRPSYEQTRPSWHTSPSPQWRMDDQLPMVARIKRHSSKTDHHRLQDIDHNRFLSANVVDYDVKENRNIQKYNHHRKEQKHISYSLMNTSTPLLDNSPTILPIIQDTSSNLLMFI